MKGGRMDRRDGNQGFARFERNGYSLGGENSRERKMGKIEER